MKCLERGFPWVWGTLLAEPWNFIASFPCFTPFLISSMGVRRRATFPCGMYKGLQLHPSETEPETHSHLHVSTIFLGKRPSGHEISLYFFLFYFPGYRCCNFHRKLTTYSSFILIIIFYYILYHYYILSLLCRHCTYVYILLIKPILLNESI